MCNSEVFLEFPKKNRCGGAVEGARMRSVGAASQLKSMREAIYVLCCSGLLGN